MWIWNQEIRVKNQELRVKRLDSRVKKKIIAYFTVVVLILKSWFSYLDSCISLQAPASLPTGLVGETPESSCREASSA